MIRPATRSDNSAILKLLDDQNLVTADLIESDFSQFFVDSNHQQIVGVIGLDSHQNSGLLRSLAVAPAHQGRKVGTALVRRLIDYSSTLGMTDLYLLTTNASAFFIQRGFTEIPRDATPIVIQKTAEFAQFCPADAIVMHRSS